MHRQYLGPPPGQDLDLGQEPGSDPVTDEVGQAFLQIQRVTHAADMPALVLYAEQQRPARGVGKRHDRLERTRRRRQVALELERLAFGAFEDLHEGHYLGSLLRSLGVDEASDLAAEARRGDIVETADR